MEELVNVIVAVAVIVFVVRWATSSNETPAERATRQALGFRPKNVTPDMVDTVNSMFPDIPRDNIRYELMRSGNVEATTNKILERGFLDAPPPSYFTIFTRDTTSPAAAQPGDSAPAPAAATGISTGTKETPQESLIQRLNLQERLKTAEPIDESQVGGKAVWEDTVEKREASLKERKAQMVLAARQRFLAQQQGAKADS